ncbi:metabotropic glutamate receptor 1-like [Physella acuta]|uniref:metabotropic glutamate receptor 1-like n=1 Tax=Physella acuta TaxID=109671 RepID=UPI0027DD9DA5|nr:metabotropic glutamate receptor 1-like [Physella acuta]
MSGLSMLHTLPLVLSSLFLMLNFPHYSHQYVYSGDLKDVYFYKPGDFIIGGSFGVTYDCHSVHNNIPYALMRTMVHAVDVVNREKKILPDFTLGYFIIDNCQNSNISALQALRFIPQSHLATHDDKDIPGYLRSFDVIGVVGTEYSLTTIPLSVILGAIQMPVISSWATDDALKNKLTYPTIFRVTSSMPHHIDGLLHFLRQKEWLYFSVIADATEYGHRNVKLLKKSYKRSGMCIAVISSVSEDVDFKSLLLYHREKFGVYVIVAFVRYSLVEKISSAVKSAGLEGSLVVIGCDFFYYDLYEGNLARGFLSLGPPASPVSGLRDHLLGLDDKEPHDPWLESIYEKVYQCYKKLCAQHFRHDANLINALPLGDVADIVEIYAKALSNLLAINCYEKSKAEAVSCFRQNKAKMISHIESVKSFTDQTKLFFDTDRNRVTEVSIFQSIANDTVNKVVEISRYDYYTKTITFLTHMDFEGFTVPEEKFLASQHCQPACAGDSRRSLYSRCCWACVKCSDYEIVAENGTNCEKCPTLYWPSYEDSKKTNCALIKLSYVTIFSLYSQLLIFVSLSLLCMAVFTQYVYYTKRRFLKMNRTHIVIANGQISAIAVGYLAIPVLVVQPKPLNCFIGLSLFEISFTALYLCLAIKTFDLVYCSRNAIGDREYKEKLREFERTAAVLLIIFESIIIALMHILFPAEMVSQQPSELVNYAENVCSFPPVHIYLFLGHNLTLLVVCLLMIVRYRTFQVHYSESEFLFTCLTIKMTTWASFIPAYFMSDRLQIRIYYIIFVILINHTTALALLLAPRLYYVLTNARYNAKISSLSMLHTLPPVLSSLFLMLNFPHYSHQYVYVGDLKDVYFYKPGDFLIGGSFGVTVDCKRVQNSIPYFMMRTMIYAIETILYNLIEVPGYLRSFDVIGLVGTEYSLTTIPISSILGAVNLPVISSWATDDELSNKKQYPTFFRITATMKHQIRVLVQFLAYKGWSYFSVIAEQTTYGICFVTLLKNAYKSHGLSIAVISRVRNDVDAESLLLYHRKHFGVYVILVFVRYQLVQMISKAVNSSGLEGSVIIIGCDFFLYDLYYGNLNKGILVMGPSAYPVPGLQYHLLELDKKEPRDPCPSATLERDYKQKIRKYEITAAVLFVLFEVIMLASIHIAVPVEMVSQQPSELVKYAEKVCKFPPVHIYMFLGHNLTLLVVCLLMIVRYRTFQVHYSESKFLFTCLSIQMTTWACFIPAYFMSDRLKIRIYYIIFVILINHTTALALLLAPRLYYVLTNAR